ncbi:MAG: helix-turn-helix domain-containing protein [Lachnospiraceae bacterium]|nr:helix-turn-helix domain-containing protein [Lachnospiraceae bacterium]
MIRKYKSFFALMKNKCKSTELYDKAVNELDIENIECPYCKNTGQCKKHGRYTRYILEWVKGKRVCSSMEVIRVQCQHCNKTHSFLPSFIIPYSSYGLCFVLSVVQSYYQRSRTVLQICERYDISESMLYRWKHIFEQCYENWIELLGDLMAENKNTNPQLFIKKIGNVLDFVSFIDFSDSLLNNYHLLFHRSFMEHLSYIQRP